MAATSTLLQVLSQLVEETGVGYVIPAYSGTTTTLTLANSYLAGPFSGVKYPVGSPILITSTTGLGETTYLSNYAPSTGVITVSPAITTGSSTAILVYADNGIDHPDRLTEAVQRAVSNRLTRWQRTPLTFVPDGDLRGTTVGDYWTGTNATPSYVTPTFPAGSAAAAFGFAGIQRVLQSVTSNATNRVTSNLINLALNATTQAYQWYFQTAIRVVSGSGNAQLLVWDETNNAQITTNVISGSDSMTHVTTSLGFLNIEGTCNIPATCKQISFRLVSSATSTTIQMTPLVAYPVDAVSFPIPNRIISEEYIGNFRYLMPVSGVSGPYSRVFSDPVTSEGRQHSIQNYGDHMTVSFNFRPTRPLWFDELTYDASPSLLTDTLTFPLDQIVKWSRAELFRYLYEREQPQYRVTSYGSSIPIPSRWKLKAIEAMRSANYSEYEPKAVVVTGRV